MKKIFIIVLLVASLMGGVYYTLANSDNSGLEIMGSACMEQFSPDIPAIFVDPVALLSY